jgi:hypothetical protein
VGALLLLSGDFHEACCSDNVRETATQIGEWEHTASEVLCRQAVDWELVIQLLRKNGGAGRWCDVAKKSSLEPIGHLPLDVRWLDDRCGEVRIAQCISSRGSCKREK